MDGQDASECGTCLQGHQVADLAGVTNGDAEVAIKDADVAIGDADVMIGDAAGTLAMLTSSLADHRSVTVEKLSKSMELHHQQSESRYEAHLAQIVRRAGDGGD